MIGAGTMGAGIAQLAALTGAETVLHDPVADALERGMARIESGLDDAVRRGRLSADQAAAARARLGPAGELRELAGCGLVIEAVPERLELKRELFAQLAAVVGRDCVLATNTSSLPVTEIAAAAAVPERVVGMHFFNPPQAMKLVEVVAGAVSAPEALALAHAVVAAMGRVAIDAPDIPGFIVNRCNRAFSLVALALLAERTATVREIDLIARLEGGFRMGPFELMDLVGLDTNHAVAESLFRRSFGEPRFRPSPLQARMVAAGRLGRKSGWGWYSYAPGGGPANDDFEDPQLPAPGGGAGRVLALVGDGPLVLLELAAAAQRAGFEVGREPRGGEEPWLALVGERDASVEPAPRARFLWDSSLHACDPEAAGMHVIAPFEAARVIETAVTPRTDPVARERLLELVRALGRHPVEVGDAPGLVLGRILSCLINEAAFLIGERHAAPADVDLGLTLGANHPRGLVAWSRALGLRHAAGILDALRRESGEERYRTAPLLRRRLALGEPGLD